MNNLGVDPLDRYRARVVPQPHVSIAESLLAFWSKPWSGTALRFAYHAMTRAMNAGIDVLEHERNPSPVYLTVTDTIE
jgi:hypothetical protein